MIDKSGWNLVKFGDVVVNLNQSTKHFPNDEFEIIVGLDHMDSENLHIVRWERNEGSYSFTKVFHKGQTLYGKRRAYQKKVAIAEFDGICSGDILVFDSKDENVLISRLIPFICMSELFYKYVEANSQGSLSPRVSFTALAKYEFLLPPIEEQKRIAEILWAADENFEQQKRLLHSLKETNSALMNELIFSADGHEMLLKEFATFNEKNVKAKDITPEQIIKYIDIGCIIKPKVLGEIKTFVFSEAPSRARRIAKTGDVLIATVRPNLMSFYRIDSGEYIVSTGFAVATPKNNDLGEILYHVIFSNQFIDYCNNKAIGTNYPAISVGDIENFKVSISHKYSINDIADKLKSLQIVMESNDKNINNGSTIKTDLLSLYFGGAN